jgi:5-methylcytosine-specific restriction endonuclease McrA
MTIRPTHPDGRPLTVKEYYARAGARKTQRAAKAAWLWPKRAAEAPPAAVRPRRRPPTDRQRLRGRLDALWALVVKKRDRRLWPNCRICGGRPIEVAYHIVPRGDDATRWALDNGVGACAPCNRGEQLNRSRYRAKHVRLFGEAKMRDLEARARQTVKYSQADLQQMHDDLKALLSAG